MLPAVEVLLCHKYVTIRAPGIGSVTLHQDHNCDPRVNFHRQTQGENVVSRSTVNLSFSRLLPKITKIQKIQQGTKNEVKWKEARYRQMKQWLIILDRLPEEKE